MKQEKLDQLETGLRRIPPAAVPLDLMERLRAAKVAAQPTPPQRSQRTFRWPEWVLAWRGLAAVAPAAAILLICLALRPAAEPGKANAAGSPGIKANAVRVGHSLVASFDAVAQWPDGEPVRFHCRKWQDDVVVHDDANGVFITQSTPRIELVPVRFETY